jgi:hypothetical protein
MTLGDYTRVNFINNVTPLDEDNMNNMDAKIEELDSSVGDAVANEHTHANKAQLDLVTDGDHDVRSDNPHGVDKTDVGLSNVTNNAQLPLSGGTMSGGIDMNNNILSDAGAIKLRSNGVTDILEIYGEYLDYTQVMALKSSDSNNYGDFRFYSQKTDIPDTKEMMRLNGDDSLIEMGGNRVTNLGTPTGSTDAVTKAYADAMTAADSSKLNGKSVSSAGDWWDVIPIVAGDGVMEIGKYIDFHETDDDTDDYDARISCVSGVLQIGGNTIWHAGNDGDGSTLDADLLDGHHGDEYMLHDEYSWYEWKRDYLIPSASSLPLLDRSDADFGATGDSEILIECGTTGTGANTGLIARYRADDGGAWTVETIWKSGSDSNHPQAIIDGSGRPAISNPHTGAAYHFAVRHTRISNATRVFDWMNDIAFTTGYTMTGQIATAGGTQDIKLGDDAYIGDVDIANMVGIKGQQNGALGGIVFGSDKDTNLYRAGANALKTDDSFEASSLIEGGTALSSKYLGISAKAADSELLDGRNGADYMQAHYLNGYEGMGVDGNTSNWIRTTVNGLIPYQSGGHGALGTTSWPFLNIHGTNIYEGGTALASKYLGITAKAADSELLDGVNGASYLRSDASDTFNGTQLTLDTNIVVDTDTKNKYFALTRTGSMAKEWVKHTVDDVQYLMHYNNDEATGTIRWNIENTDTESGGGADANTTSMILYGESSDPRLEVAGSKVWTAGNDGSGSGLDADLLDGLDSLAFVKKDGTVAMTGNLAMGNNDITGVKEVIGQYGDMIASRDEWLRLNDGNGHTSGIYCGAGPLRVDGVFRLNSSTTYLDDNAGDLELHVGTGKSVKIVVG